MEYELLILDSGFFFLHLLLQALPARAFLRRPAFRPHSLTLNTIGSTKEDLLYDVVGASPFLKKVNSTIIV